MAKIYSVKNKVNSEKLIHKLVIKRKKVGIINNYEQQYCDKLKKCDVILLIEK